MERHYQQTSLVDYSLKDGETLVLQIKNVSLLLFAVNYVEDWCYEFSVFDRVSHFWCQQKSGRSANSKFFEQGLNNPSEEKGKQKEPIISIKPPPPPPAPVSPAATVQKLPTNMPPKFNLEETPQELVKGDAKDQISPENHTIQDIPDDDFGDFQTAGWHGLDTDMLILKWSKFSLVF